jgi:hypothetical protein
MNDKIRELFEQVTAPNFMGVEATYDVSSYEHKKVYPRLPNGEYQNPTVEDHWQTFQEGFEAAVKECAQIAYEYDLPKMSGPGMIIEQRIKEKFGVKE